MIKKIIRWIINIIAIILIIVIAAVIFFDAQRHYRESEERVKAAPATGHLVKAADVEIYAQEFGKATDPAVVLIHGTGTWSDIWKDSSSVIAAKGFHVIAIDLPPFGYSEKLKGVDAYSRQKQAKRILGVLDSLHLMHATLVGHSAGARPTLEAALLSPDMISKLVLVDPALGFQADPNDTPHFVQAAPGKAMKAIFASNILRKAVISTYGTNPLFIKNLLSSFVSKKDSLTPERIETIKQPMRVQDTTEAYADWLQNLLESHDDSLGSDFTNFKNLRMPVEIIWGKLDTITPLWHGEALHKMIPQSKLDIIDGVGHIPYLEDTSTFNDLLITFLEK